jgi:hypothetical protein
LSGLTGHPAADLELGGACAAVAEALTGGPPTGWGLHEPATQPWSTRELTRLARSRAPAPSSLTLVAGPPMFGADALRERGLEHARAAPAPTSFLGPAAHRKCWCRLGGTSAYETLAAVLNHFRPPG